MNLVLKKYKLVFNLLTVRYFPIDYTTLTIKIEVM